MIVRVLVEGTSDVPTIREIFVRGFGQVQGSDFQVYWHRGKGHLPSNPSAPPNPRDATLLGLLPAKLRAYGRASPDDPVVVLVDADRDDWRALKATLDGTLAAITPRPNRVLFRIAVEEIESWFIADVPAVQKAYPAANISLLAGIPLDSVVGAWERLAEALGLDPNSCSGADKEDWAREISPFLSLHSPPSPTFQTFIRGLERLTGLRI
jgi:hypothetical protein